MFEKCGRTTTDADGRWTPDHGYTISSPCEPEGSGELILSAWPKNETVGQDFFSLVIIIIYIIVQKCAKLVLSFLICFKSINLAGKKEKKLNLWIFALSLWFTNIFCFTLTRTHARAHT